MRLKALFLFCSLMSAAAVAAEESSSNSPNKSAEKGPELPEVKPLDNSSSTDISALEKFEKKNDFVTAANGYMEYAKLGSPKAFYQLGVFYYNGAGVKKNPGSAYIWMSLAAEQNYKDSQQLADKLFALFNEKQQKTLLSYLANMKKQYGKETLDSKLFTELNTKNVDAKIVYVEPGGEELASSGVAKLEQLFSNYSGMEQSFDIQTFDNLDQAALTNNPVINEFDVGGDLDSFSGVDGLGGDDQDMEIAGNGTVLVAISDIYSLVVDHELESDGSMRDFDPIFTMGIYSPGIEGLKWRTSPRPTVNGVGVSFVRRTYLGLAAEDQWFMLGNFEDMYMRLRRNLNKIEDSEDPVKQFNYFKSLDLFPWLEQDENEVEIGYKKTAEAGVPEAQYEYGMYLYRKQKSIPEAINWIEKAAKNGVVRAQYRLAKLLFDSPWVISDEKKALYWFSKVADKGNDNARRRAALIKLSSKDKSLLDVDGAKVLLDIIDEDNRVTPEYTYALALYSRKKKAFKDSVKYIEKAIRQADSRNWDTTDWLATLEGWLTGRVRVQDTVK